MKTEELFELLTIVNGIKSTNWKTLMQLVDVIAKGGATIKDKKWNDSWKQDKPEYYPLNLAELKTWSTYGDTCVDLQFSNDASKGNGQPNNQLVCKAKIYDGNSFSGEKEQLRFEALLWLPASFIHTIKQGIEGAFETYLEDAYENHLEAQKKLWINNTKKKILLNIEPSKS